MTGEIEMYLRSVKLKPLRTGIAAVIKKGGD